MQNLSYENEFDLHLNELVSKNNLQTLYLSVSANEQNSHFCLQGDFLAIK